MGKNRAGKGITSRQQAIKAAKPQEARPKRRGAPGKLVGKAEAAALWGGKRKSRGQGAASGGGGGGEPSARKQRRREQREERQRAKLQRVGSERTSTRRRFTNAQLSATDSGGSRLSRDSDWRKDVRRQQLQMQRAVAAVDAERERLEAHIAPEVEAEIRRKEQEQERRLQSLHPVARRIEVENDPDLGYIDPGSGQCIVRLPRPDAEDLFQTTPQGGFGARSETRPFLELLRDAGAACRAAGKPDEAVEYLRELERLDSSDAMDLRPALVLALLDADADDDGAALARQILERHPQDKRTALQYSRALIEYIGWRLLGEDGCTEESATAALNAAIAANPFAAVFIAHAQTFTKFVDPAEVDHKIGTGALNQGVVEEAFRYGVDGLSCWGDADGSEEWVLQHLPAPLPAPVGAADWVEVYNKAIDHAMEAAMVSMFGGGDDAGDAGDAGDAADDDTVPCFAEDGSLIGFKQAEVADEGDAAESSDEGESSG